MGRKQIERYLMWHESKMVVIFGDIKSLVMHKGYQRAHIFRVQVPISTVFSVNQACFATFANETLKI